MNKLFGLTTAEIGSPDGATPQRVGKAIKAVYDLIITGKEIFLSPTDEQINTAKANLVSVSKEGCQNQC